MPKINLDPPPKMFFCSGIEDFAHLGTYIIYYTKVLVPNVHVISDHDIGTIYVRFCIICNSWRQKQLIGTNH